MRTPALRRPSAVVHDGMVQVVPSDDERTPTHPPAGEVRFHGAPSPFGPLRATVAQPGDLRAGGAMPAYALQGVHTGGGARRHSRRTVQHNTRLQRQTACIGAVGATFY